MRHDHLCYAAVGAHGDKLIGNVSARHCVKGACRLVCKQKLLLHAGYAQLYVRDPRDSILFYALDNGMSLVACNQQLDERGEAILG